MRMRGRAMFRKKLDKLIHHPYMFFYDIGKKKRMHYIETEKYAQHINYREDNMDNNVSGKKIDVSVIVPVFNVEKFLNKCIESLINQNDKNLEFIFVNDGSTDKSLDILYKYAKSDKRIIVINCRRNIGVAAARNLAISIAHGSFIGFVDPDDYVSKNYFGSMYRMARLQDADIVMTNNVVRFPSRSVRHKNMGFRVNKKIDDDVKINIMKTTGVTWNKIYNRKLLLNNNIMFPEIKTMGTDNYITTLALFFAKKIITTDKVIYYYRENPNSIINKKKDASYYLLTEVYHRCLQRIFYSSEKRAKKQAWIQAVTERALKDSVSNLKKFETNLEKIEYINSVYQFFPDARFVDIDRPVVSLTSYPGRIATVDQTIRSILNQDIPPKEVVLYLADSQFPEREGGLPSSLTDLLGKGLVIRWCEDMRSYKKLIPALSDYPEDIIITADDDVIYPGNWLRTLLTAHFRQPEEVQCLRGRKILMEQGHFLPYSEYRLIKYDEPSSFFILQTGLGGCLYKKSMLHEDVARKELFTSLCADGDDIWFWAMAVLKGTKIHWCAPGLNDPLYIEGTQESGTCLWEQNKQGGNDEHFMKLVNHYPQLADIADQVF